MLYMALTISVILVVITNAVMAVRHNKAAILNWTLGFSFLGILLGCMLPVVGLHCFLTALTFPIWTAIKKGRFWYYSTAAGFLAYGLVALFSVKDQLEYARLREECPFESLEKRVQPPSHEYRVNSVNSEMQVQLEEIENRLEMEGSFRSFMLSRLHDSTVTSFIDSPGFGVGRRIRPNFQYLTSMPTQAIPHPGPPPSSIPPFAEEKN